MSDFSPHPVPDPTIDLNGRSYMHDAKGGLTPVELVRPADKLRDEQVRKIIGYAIALSDQVARFKGHTFADIGAFDALLEQEYGLKIGGAKGNKTYYSYDGRFKVEVRVHDRMDFGPELQIAKALIDECLIEWSADSRAEIRAIVTAAFHTDKVGQVNKAEMFRLLRLDITEARWLRAMQAIQDAMLIVGSKTYVRCSQRESFDAAWKPITIDLAKA